MPCSCVIYRFVSGRINRSENGEQSHFNPFVTDGPGHETAIAQPDQRVLPYILRQNARNRLACPILNGESAGRRRARAVRF
jgi:hypothetical protein